MSRMAAETELDVDVRSVQGSPRLYLRLNWGFRSKHNLVHQYSVVLLFMNRSNAEVYLIIRKV